MVSIIIPTLNEEKYLPQLLDSLKAQTYRDFEIIVADSNSKDNTQQIALAAGARIAQGGIAAIGRNNGAAMANGDLFLFLDADISFHPNFLSEVIEEFNDRHLDIATCSISKDVDNKIAKAVYYIGGVNDQIRQYTKFPVGAGACLLVKREVHDKLNGFNSSKELQEDWDYIKRAAKNHYKYRIIKNDFYASTRRFDNNNIVKLAAGAVLGAIVITLGIKSVGVISKMYGGWGDYEKKEKKKFKLFQRPQND